jgi:hypothetical protein
MITKFSPSGPCLLVPDDKGEIHFESGYPVPKGEYPLRGYLVNLNDSQGRYSFVRVYHMINVVNAAGGVQAEQNPAYFKKTIVSGFETCPMQTRIK